MGAITFDTLKFVETLTGGGLAEREAKAIATAYCDAASDQQLVTKSDLKAGLDELRAELKADIAEVRAEIAEVKTDMDARFAGLEPRFANIETKIAEMKFDLVKWIIGLGLAQIAVFVSLTLKAH